MSIKIVKNITNDVIQVQVFSPDSEDASVNIELDARQDCC